MIKVNDMIFLLEINIIINKQISEIFFIHTMFGFIFIGRIIGIIFFSLILDISIVFP